MVRSAHAIDARHGYVFSAVVKDVLVDFVGDAVGVPTGRRRLADEFELGSREDFASRIIGRVQNDCFGMRAKSGRRVPFSSKDQSGVRSLTKRGVAPLRIASGP